MAGNTTMTHLLLGVDPRHVMLSPYTPAAMSFPVLRAGDLGLKVNDHAEVRLSPCVASYVGGDIVAGVIGSGMFQREKTALYVDIGTNGEIVLGQGEWLMSASCSAGPAFEGGGILCGMRAGKGAIEQVQIDPATFEPMILTIGRERPLGLCGSGLIDLLGGLFRAGLIDERGKYRPERQAKRVRGGEYGLEYVVVEGASSGHGKDIVLTEADIDNLIRTKAALFAGCRVLLDAAGLTFQDLDAIMIAGGFGRFIDPLKAQAIGLLPEVPLERFLFVGNGSLLGAKLLALSRQFSDEAVTIARAMTNVELSGDRRFMDEFVAAMFLPHTDLNLFPSSGREDGQE